MTTKTCKYCDSVATTIVSPQDGYYSPIATCDLDAHKDDAESDVYDWTFETPIADYPADDLEYVVFG